MIRKITMASAFILTTIFYAQSSMCAEPVFIECPKVYTTNPFQILRIENGDDWQRSDATGYLMHCRSYVNPQGYMTCFYEPAAHGASDVYTLKKMPPDNMTCKETNIACRFECSSKTPEINIKKLLPIKKRP
ncbi:MAG: hypothetical protein JXR79_02390 [Nitrospirae bacterium]|nr:hypothetical protein [Nitrospirota bacterium]